MAPRYLFLELIQEAFWVHNGKNNGFTKISVGSWKSYIVCKVVIKVLLAGGLFSCSKVRQTVRGILFGNKRFILDAMF